jgi:hypothetical protein
MSDYKILGEGLDFSEQEVSDMYAYVTASNGGGVDADLDAICDYYYGIGAFQVDIVTPAGSRTVSINFPDPIQRINDSFSDGGSGRISDSTYTVGASAFPVRLVENGITVGYNLSGVFSSNVRFDHPSGGAANLDITPYVYSFQGNNLSANNTVTKVQVGRGLYQYARASGSAGFTEAIMDSRVSSNLWANQVRTLPSNTVYWTIAAGGFTYTN